MSDVNDRLKLIMVSAGLPNTPDVVAKVKPQVIGGLIEEAIKRQEGARLKLTADPAEIDDAIKDIAAQNKMTPDQFQEMFKRGGIPMRTLKDQIRSQLLWVKIVTKQLRPQIEISESDIDVELENIKAKMGQNEYLVSEIILPIDRPQDEGDALQLGQKMIAQIRAKPESFSALARQFSRAAGAVQGGDLGWVAGVQMPEELENALNHAEKGDVIGPTKTPGGMHILLVRNKRARTESNLPSRDDIANRIGMERLDRMQRRYLLDLKSSAFLDARGQ